MKKIITKTIGLVLFTLFIANLNSYSQSFDKEVFAQRRQQFMGKMSQGVAVFISPVVCNRNSDVDYPYRQNSDFYYLTGYTEPESAFILSPGSKNEFVMFVKARNPMTKMWTGEVCGIEGAMEKYGADTAFEFNQFSDMITFFLRGKETIYYNMSDDGFNDRISEVINYQWGSYPKQIINTSDLVHSMRIIKSQEEIAMMQKAIDATCDAHLEALRFTEPEKFEYEVKALIEYTFAKNNCPRNGFPSIVASGSNATILHYEGQQRKMENGDLLLMDIGAEYGYYSADITRTIPVNGKFTKTQKTVYEIVLATQELGIKMMEKGVGIQKVVNRMTEFASEELYNLGLITDKTSEWQSRLWYFPYTCHWLGLDVHDVQGDVEMNEDGVILQPGMVTTIEPGLYINPENLNNLEQMLNMYRIKISSKEIEEFIKKVQPVVKQYANIGIRIEDDILITDEGNRVLSSKAPKTVKDIEYIMNQ
ncbi:MAG TPA: Xaa-Pro aminopeptidase [Bacteroidales bacterium]|nr:Xaa-Pro aminopeptidase [Bacteroidales bacterium]